MHGSVMPRGLLSYSFCATPDVLAWLTLHARARVVIRLIYRCCFWSLTLLIVAVVAFHVVALLSWCLLSSLVLLLFFVVFDVVVVVRWCCF